MSFTKLLIPAILACLCNTAANTLWRIHLSRNPFSTASMSDMLSTILTVNIIVGVLFYICSMLLFFYMLSNFKLSAIMPVTCLTYVFNIAVAVAFLKETIVPAQAIGTAVIIFGLLILSRA